MYICSSPVNAGIHSIVSLILIRNKQPIAEHGSMSHFPGCSRDTVFSVKHITEYTV